MELRSVPLPSNSLAMVCLILYDGTTYFNYGYFLFHTLSKVLISFMVDVTFSKLSMRLMS